MQVDGLQCLVGLYAIPELPPGCTSLATATASVCMRAGSKVWEQTALPFTKVAHGIGRGYRDFFGLGPRGAWDAAAWHQAGLVEGSQFKLRVTVCDVV